MELMENISRIKDNLFLIKAERLDKLTNDPDYMTSFIYILACLAVSIPFFLLGSFLDGTLMVAILAIPFYIVAGIVFNYFAFGIYHMFLRIMGGKAPIERSIQLMIYGMTPSLVFGTIPLLGAIAGLLGLANVILGAEKVHGISVWRAFVALFVLPLVLAIILGLVIVTLLGSMFTTTGLLS